MIDDSKIIEEALEQPDEEAVVQYLVDRADQLSEDVRNRLMLSVLSKALGDEAARKERMADLLEAIVEAKKQVDQKSQS
jgi:hypothetical protein